MKRRVNLWMAILAIQLVMSANAYASDYFLVAGGRMEASSGNLQFALESSPSSGIRIVRLNAGNGIFGQVPMPLFRLTLRQDSDERQTLRKVLPESDPEPDFYYMARNKFQSLYIVVMYLLFFVVVFFHLRHAFPSAFQTLGLNNYKYNNIIEVLGRIYTWLVCLMFAVVPILVYLGL